MFKKGFGEPGRESSGEQGEKSPEGVLMSQKGVPLLLYRGSSLSLSLSKEARYQREHLGHSTEAPSAGEAFFFTDRKRTANYYSRGKNPNKERAVKKGGDPHIDKVHLIMKKPFVHDFKGKVHRDAEDTYFNLIQKAKESGHDGVIFKNTFDAGEYGYFDAVLGGRFLGETIYGVFVSDQVLVQETEPLVSPRKKAKLLEGERRDVEKRREKRKRERARLKSRS